MDIPCMKSLYNENFTTRVLQTVKKQQVFIGTSENTPFETVHEKNKESSLF
jgi:hypothetical protein